MMKNQRGITLIEMMIAMLVGLIITAGVMAMFISNVKSSSENVKMIRLNQQLRGVLNFISDEIKRAGYSADPTVDAFITDFNFDVAASCLRYSYDEDGDGVQDANERYGFHLNAGAIRWSNNVTTTDCSNGNWQNITDTEIASITGFTATDAPIAAGTISIEQLIVTLTGQVSLNPGTATRTVNEIIRVRNENAS